MSKENTENSAVQSGSVVADNSKEEYRTQGPTDNVEQPKADETPKDQSDATANTDGESGLPESAGQGGFMEKLSQQLDNLNSSIQTMGQNGQPGEQAGAQEEARDFDAELQALQAQATDGDISYQDLIVKSQEIQDAKTQQTVAMALQNYDNQQQATGMQQSFLQENPEYQQFVQSPENQQMQQANPMLDDISAYYSAKASREASRASQVEAELAELKARVGTSVRAAAGVQTARVGTESGSDLRQSTKSKSDNISPRDGMLGVLQGMRQQV